MRAWRRRRQSRGAKRAIFPTKEKMYNAYILFSGKNKRYYTGSAEDVEIRLKKQNQGRVLSTKSGVPWNMVYSESFETRTEAIKKEFEIKSRGAKRFLEHLGLS